MKLVIRTVVFHTFSIILFASLYLYLSKDFKNGSENNNTSLMDFILLSTTIQTGVGLTDLLPISYYGKLAVIIQQYIMLLTHVITLYIFTI